MTKSVLMDDGRTQTFGEKAKCKKSTIRNSLGMPSHVRFDYSHGAILECELRQIPVDMLEELVAHGIRQKVGDEGADSDSPQEYHTAAKAMWMRILERTAFQRVPGGGIGYQDLIVAIAEWQSIDEAEAEEFCKSITPDERKALRQEPDLKVILDRRAAESVKDVKMDDLKARLQALKK